MAVDSIAIWPKISLVTPSFNQGEFLEETIVSVLSQNYPNLEYIIIDGGSTDNTLEIIKKYENELTYWISERDQGQSHAINKGLKKCSGEIFNWINSDDLLADNALFHIAKGFNEDVDVVGGYCSFFENDKQKVNYVNRIKATDNLEDTIINYGMCQPPTFYKLNLVKELNGVSETLNYIMDSFLWIKYLAAYGTRRVKLIDENISYFRLHGDSKTVSNSNRFLQERTKVFTAMVHSLGVSREVTKVVTQEVELQYVLLAKDMKLSFLSPSKFIKLYLEKYDVVKLLLLTHRFQELKTLLTLPEVYPIIYRIKLRGFMFLPNFIKRAAIRSKLRSFSSSSVKSNCC